MKSIKVHCQCLEKKNRTMVYLKKVTDGEIFLNNKEIVIKDDLKEEILKFIISNLQENLSESNVKIYLNNMFLGRNNKFKYDITKEQYKHFEGLLKNIKSLKLYPINNTDYEKELLMEFE